MYPVKKGKPKYSDALAKIRKMFRDDPRPRSFTQVFAAAYPADYAKMNQRRAYVQAALSRLIADGEFRKKSEKERVLYSPAENEDE